MKLPEIKALPVGDLAAKDCHLFMWTTGPNLEQAFEVMKAWGFHYSSVAFTWVKLWNSRADTLFMTDNDFVIGLGHTTRKNTEYCLLGRKGSPKRRSKSVRELLIAARREHSRKPDEAVRRIEEYADGPYLELFARTSRPNWTAWGNQTDRFPEAVA
jgi:N6-adenosine-specific RNA methylase IME4